MATESVRKRVVACTVFSISADMTWFSKSSTKEISLYVKRCTIELINSTFSKTLQSVISRANGGLENKDQNLRLVGLHLVKVLLR